MSTIRVVNLQHPDSVEPNVVLKTDGTAVFASGITISGSTNLTVSGTAEFASGTAANPEITFIDDNNTGIYSPAGDTLAITTSGTERLRVNESGDVGIGTSNPFSALHLFYTGAGTSVATSGATDPTTGARIGRGAVGIDFGVLDNGTSYLQNRNISNFAVNYNFVINPNGGNVGVGTTSPAQILDIASTAPNIRLTDTIDGHSEIDGNAASLKFNADKGNVKAGSNISFAVDNTEVARFLSGGGLTFNGDTAAANALDDYEEGSFTPTLTDATAYTNQIGYYTKIGRLVTFCIRVQANAASPSTSALEIGGLPFTSVSISAGPYGGAFRSYGLLVDEGSITNLNYHIPVNSTVIRPLSNAATIATNNSAVNLVGNFLFNGFYYTA